MALNYNFRGQVALVTGASSGIGLATAWAFAKTGAKVALADVDQTSLVKAVAELQMAGHAAVGIRCDVSDEVQVAAMIATVVSTLGRLDMAYNNAGILGFVRDLTLESGEEYDRVVAVNLRVFWACMKHELLQMEQQGSGAIVNCSSLGGLVGLAGRASYHATKHGVIGPTKSAAMDNATKGIRVNAVCPGVIETPMAKGITEEHMKDIVRDQPIGRLGAPEEVAAAVLWLCSSESSFVLGVALPVDGGDLSPAN